jgi:dGTPase
MTEEERHRQEVLGRIRTAKAAGLSDFHEILAECDGADPRLVFECLGAPAGSTAGPAPSIATIPREAFIQLPAADPSRSQWWFSGETIDLICDRVMQCNPERPILCLGAPTIGHALLKREAQVVILDVDPNVVEVVNEKTRTSAARLYDASDPLPADVKSSISVAVMDPPWYPEAARAFLQRGLDALVAEGHLLMSLPPRLTRPGTDKFRSELIDQLLKLGHELLGLQQACVRYLVPRFEEAALADGIGFRGIPWRRADLLHVRKNGSSAGPEPTLAKTPVRVFARRSLEFRVFLASTSSADAGLLVEPLPAYAKNISTRAYGGQVPDVWTSEKAGFRVGQRELVTAVLEAWSDITVRTREEAIAKLEPKHGAAARRAVHDLDREMLLWSRFAAQPTLRTDEQIEKAKRESLTEWAADASKREYKHDGDSFRAAYQRDRDRILWAGSFRRLGHKTQLFPFAHDDQTRQRLSHSIEVMQLASTIGASFGLDRDLIEAGALAHDIGHTPFGHAGEHALNSVLDDISPQLGGFNHYEHGVDVIRWLEGAYYVSKATGFHGLNLTPEVAECVLKHTYCHSLGSISVEKLLSDGKHGDFVKPGYCHLEGQAVRIADKISYFVSDVEDGLRLGAIGLMDLAACHFFHRAPLSFVPDSRVSIYQSFLLQRRSILGLLMQDVLVSTSKRLVGVKPGDVRNVGRYTVDHSEEMSRDVTEVWNRLQVARLHQDHRVKLAILQAARIVSDLTILLAVAPTFIDPDFASEYSRLHGTVYIEYYAKRAGTKVKIPESLVKFIPLERAIGFKYDPAATIPIEQVIRAKDFVAGLTDSRARALHSQLLRD